MTGWAGRGSAVWRCVVAHRWLIAVLVVGLALRAVLLPVTYGPDFVVWDKASASTLLGNNIYAHHPSYPAGPYAYFPLFLYLELPFQWISQHTPLTFTILGKLPIVVGDVGTAALLARELAARGSTSRQVGCGTALFFLNPLVLYNGAYYGRFDTLACGLLLLSLELSTRLPERPRAAAVVFALAVASKTFPAVMIFTLIREGRQATRKVLLVVAVVLTLLSLPYVQDLPAYIHDVVLYDSEKHAQGLSWQQVLPSLTTTDVALAVSYVLLGVFGLAAYGLSRLRRDVVSASTLTLLTLLLFILCSKVILEQYLIWPMPWLVLQVCSGRGAKAPAGLLLALLSVVGLLFSSLIQPFGAPPLWICNLLAASIAGYVFLELCRVGLGHGGRPVVLTARVLSQLASLRRRSRGSDSRELPTSR